MIIKVCGMRDADNIRKVEDIGIDLMGFIFSPKSSRYVSEPPTYLPTKCKRVGVFVDASIGDVMTIVEQYQFNIIQLHGNESPSYITQLRSHLPAGVKIIKAFNIATDTDLNNTKDYQGLADYFLFDAKGMSAGGNGHKFDWSILSAYNGPTQFLLSGGIGPVSCDMTFYEDGFAEVKTKDVDFYFQFDEKQAADLYQLAVTFVNENNQE